MLFRSKDSTQSGAEGRKRLWVRTPEGAGATMTLEGRCRWGGVDFLERTRVGSRTSAEMARLREDEDREDAGVLG